ncbi:MAG TPA: hypothetical protein VL126_16830 [Bacteroidota bacterium]|nr:hypothetical protein [Bacteroidota bacterium]
MKKTVALVGATRALAVLGYALAAAGYTVVLTGDFRRHPVRLLGRLPLVLLGVRFSVPQANVRLVFSERDACWESDLIIPSMPRKALAELACKVNDVVTGKIVVSLQQSVDGNGETPMKFTSAIAAGELDRLFPHCRIVDAFWVEMAGHCRGTGISGNRADVLVTGDEPEAVSTVVDIVSDLGYPPRMCAERRPHDAING